MIFSESKLSVGDNCGAKNVKVIQVFRSSKSSGSKPMDLAVVSIRKVRRSKRIVKGEIHKGVLIRLKKKYQRDTGLSIKFSSNTILLVDLKKVPIGSRLFGPIFKEFRLGEYPKVLSLAKTLL